MMLTLKNTALTRAFPIAIVATSICFLTFACGESKVAQCNKFINVANKAKDFSASSQDLKNTTDPNKIADKITELADKLDGLNQEIKGIGFSDDKLKSFQTQYADLYSTSAKDMRSLAGAVKSKNAAEANRSAKNLQEIAPKLISVDQDLQKYCASN
jgi:septal ring factor EnvC (AmiA/AmiB activator)